MALTPTEHALFEAVGPKARRRIVVGTIVSVIALLALGVWIVLRLYDNGQFSPMY